ncbi:MAG: site-specific DNA-methyltransferase [Verrucomicrobiia bacterium]
MSFNSRLTDLLKKDSRFVDGEGELLITAVQDRAWKIDHDLVKLLLSDKEIKAKFFDEIAGHWVFNLNTFIEYISQKNFLDNSYTRFRNRIGLTVGDKYLRERGDVALAWPYKDTVLEGGQTKEDEKRKEIFFNEVLAEDEINRLLDPKVLANFVRYTTKGKQSVKEFKRDENGIIRENLIVKGNNLLVLHTLNKIFRGQVKLLYIDPPYNTGSDSFGYNDSFNHSTWLTFMKNRLEAAKDLLSEEGSVWVNIDDNEIAYLTILMDQIFGRANYITTVTVKRSGATGHKAINPSPIVVSDFVLAYSKTSKWKYKIQYAKRDYDTAYSLFIENFNEDYRRWRFVGVEEAMKKMKCEDIYELIAKCPERVIRFAEPSYEGVGSETRALIDKSLKRPKEILKQEREDHDDIYLLNGQRILFYKNKLKRIDGEMVTAETLTNIWLDIPFQGIAKEGGVVLKKGKKPESLLRRIFEIGSDEGDLILDFHLGTGTAAAVAHKTKRQYIGIEQLDYGDNDSVVRLQNVIKGDQSGVSKAVNWRGGGDFIYCELMKYNEAFMERIEAAKTSKELVKIWQAMAEDSFLNWYVNPHVPEDAIKDFEAIGKNEDGVAKQKRLLAELLDKNQLYVNLAEIEDEQFKVSAEDKALNKAFYHEAHNA